MDHDTLKGLLKRARSGDQQAAVELLREFEPALRREARLLLADETLRPLQETSDICQSAFALFFLRLRTGQFDLEHPGEVVGLLAQIARNRIRYHRRHATASKRDRRRVDEGSKALSAALDATQDPAAIVANRDMLDHVLRRLDPAIRELVERRSQGQAWAEIAAERGQRPDAVRKQFDRAVNQAVAALGLQEHQDE